MKTRTRQYTHTHTNKATINKAERKKTFDRDEKNTQTFEKSFVVFQKH